MWAWACQFHLPFCTALDVTEREQCARHVSAWHFWNKICKYALLFHHPSEQWRWTCKQLPRELAKPFHLLLCVGKQMNSESVTVEYMYNTQFECEKVCACVCVCLSWMFVFQLRRIGPQSDLLLQHLTLFFVRCLIMFSATSQKGHILCFIPITNGGKEICWPTVCILTITTTLDLFHNYHKTLYNEHFISKRCIIKQSRWSIRLPLELL